MGRPLRYAIGFCLLILATSSHSAPQVTITGDVELGYDGGVCVGDPGSSAYFYVDFTADEAVRLEQVSFDLSPASQSASDVSCCPEESDGVATFDWFPDGGGFDQQFGMDFTFFDSGDSFLYHFLLGSLGTFSASDWQGATATLTFTDDIEFQVTFDGSTAGVHPPSCGGAGGNLASFDETFLPEVYSLENPGFETAESTNEGAFPGPPDKLGDWQGDVSAIVFGENGISPDEGSRMLRFDYARPVTGASNLTASQVYQLVRFPAWLGDIVLACRFNRVAGDASTDTEFRLQLTAYEGDPSGFPDGTGITELGSATETLFSDADPGTWEEGVVLLTRPNGTDFVAVQIMAVEDVFDDQTGTEFDGHYADACELSYVHTQNGSFEVSESTSDLAFPSLPDVLRDWKGDASQRVATGDNGVPAHGATSMLRFDWARPPVGASNLTASQVYQLVDVRAAPAGSQLDATGYVNRVTGDSQTDDRFDLVLRSYLGDPSSFESQLGVSEVDTVTTSINTDADPGTWEELTTSLLLASDVDFVAVEIAAVENNTNDTSGTEFDGHYADDVTISVTLPTPPPAVPALPPWAGVVLACLLASGGVRMRSGARSERGRPK